MLWIDRTFATPEQNLACDEALLDLCGKNGGPEVLRFWEPSQHFVVLGYANKASREVNLDVCRQRDIPIQRRCSGGGTVLQGPGCLNYSLVLRIRDESPWATVAGANRTILETHQQAMAPILKEPVVIEGHTDLAIGGLKFSGNAQRRRLQAILFHGTFLLRFDLSLMEEWLAFPSNQPTYRRGRAHEDFVMNLNLPPDLVKQALRKAWNAREILEPVPDELIEQLVRDKYSQAAWTFRF
ncbi:MAG: lipoate--protein ligase family protein [Verrucomicrobia bacterium]|nr:lipoate--protein ligase family protein [Verrucomicrobiota bacterium]